ncbi:MAG TPA: hypothetical protein VLM40_19560, partial [Gemmata sp.]|nr:hypothetical protein [Gemmata sp.]
MPELGNEPPGQSASPCCSRLDFVLVTLVLAFAFLSASFVARNSDLWLHLATGRLIASGEYHFGSDPFAYTTADRYWANHSWFFDLGLYVAYGTLGGAGLVALKAIGVGIVAGLMLLTTRGRSPVWIAAACVMVGVLAMTPRLLLQPTVASYLLLAACLFCLHAGGRALALVPALIVLWVNVDVWFILGPLLVLCFGIGRLIDRDRASLPRWPWWVIPASFAASLVSPHHVFALALPMELSPAVWRSAFAVDPRFAGLFTSPWRWGSLGGSGGYNLACWAFFLLLGAGTASFVIDPRAARSWRLMVWLPFALLAAWQERLIPFFAIVAGPITALNLGEGLARSRCARCGRNTVLTATAVLSVLAWFGWTNGFGRSDRRPGWGIFVNPSLERATHGVAVWRESLAAPNEGRIFETHPDLSHYIAWFRPGERVFLDLRLDLFTNVAADYAALLRGVGLFPSNGSNEWEEVARRYRLNAILLHEPDFNRLSRTLGGIDNWEVARVDGAELLYVPKGSTGPRFDPDRIAFATDPELRPAGENNAVLLTPTPWWERLRDRGAVGSWEAAAARVYLQLLAGPRSSSPALALLAIHSARLGTEVDPRDPAAWLMLALAYESLGERTGESEAGARLTLLVEVRLVQLTTALVQAVLRDPDSSLAHQRLARIFDRRHVIDLAYSHTRESLRLLKRS